jgi:signal transduction histidine kinase
MARRSAATDVLLALGVGVEMQVELVFVDGSSRDLLIARAAALALAGALLVRRRLPVLAVALVIAGIAALESRGNQLSGSLVAPFFVLLFVSYSAGVHSEGRELLAAAVVLLGGAVIAVRLDKPPGGADDMFFATTILTGGPLLIGRLVRARVALNRALHEKALAVERDRAARAVAAVAAERARIAGELHQLVSSALASMVGQAGAAERFVRAKPDVAERAFATVEATGRQALGEIRQLLGVLRRDDEELALAPQPSLTHLRDLVARARAAGLPVEVEVEGEQAELPAGVDLTAYRVIQEALGGALDAPDDRRATVRLRYADGEVALEVTDVGAARPGEDRQLLGIRERVAVYGGELVAHPVDPAGYAVRARLPLERAA